MKTTDVYVEQLLLGLLVLFTGVLFTGRLQQFSGGGKDIGLTFQILGAAYLLGILYDRFADTLFQNLEQHSRLAIAIERIEANPVLENKGGKPTDAFPEERLRLTILEKGGGLAKYADYLRSRIRLSRAVAAILPALSMAFAVYMVRKDARKDVAPLCEWVVTTMYGLAFVLNLLHWPKRPPRTNSDAFKTYRDSKPSKGQRSWWYVQAAMRDPALLGAILLIGFLCWVVSNASDWHIWLIPVGALAVTAFAGWVWYRINWTHLTLLRDYANKECEQRTT